MSGDEVFILLVSAAIASAYWGRWYVRLVRLDTLAGFGPIRSLIPLLHLLCFLLMLLVLTTLAATEVRDHVAYIALFLATWAVAVGAVDVVSALLGISALHDAVERRNPAALWAVGGAWLATTLCACGANIGEGPTIYTTLGPLAVAVGALVGMWLLFATATNSTAAIVVDRDRASGIRLAGLLVACGLVLGRAVAGDWVSSEATVHDFAQTGWPVLVLFVIATALERIVQPGPRRPFPPPVHAGVFPAVAYLALASAWLAGGQ